MSMLVDPDSFAGGSDDATLQKDVKYKPMDRSNRTKSRHRHLGGLKSDHTLRWTANSMYSGRSVELSFLHRHLHLCFLPVSTP